MLKIKKPIPSPTKGKFQPDKFFKYKGQTIRVWHNPNDGFWYDEAGTAYGLTKGDSGFNGASAAGAGVFTLPAFFYRINDYCKVHDNAYSIPIWQAHHSRNEADTQLETSLQYLANSSFISETYYGILARTFRILASIFGGLRGKLSLWENKSTRNLITIKMEDDNG